MPSIPSLTLNVLSPSGNQLCLHGWARVALWLSRMLFVQNLAAAGFFCDPLISLCEDPGGLSDTAYAGKSLTGGCTGKVWRWLLPSLGTPELEWLLPTGSSFLLGPWQTVGWYQFWAVDGLGCPTQTHSEANRALETIEGLGQLGWFCSQKQCF